METKHDWRSFGKRGARIRMRKLSGEQRREVARKAARARWQGTSEADRSAVMRAVVTARWHRVKATQKGHSR